jgi:hypothetical protein
LFSNRASRPPVSADAGLVGAAGLLGRVDVEALPAGAASMGRMASKPLRAFVCTCCGFDTPPLTSTRTKFRGGEVSSTKFLFYDYATAYKKINFMYSDAYFCSIFTYNS